LLHGGAAVRAVAVEVRHGPLEFDHGRRQAESRELAQGRVGGAHVLDVELVFHLPVVGAGRLDLIAEPLAEELAQELGGDRLLLELQEFAAGLQVGPVNGDLVGAILGRAL
jgi:hypothetical protein